MDILTLFSWYHFKFNDEKNEINLRKNAFLFLLLLVTTSLFDS